MVSRLLKQLTGLLNRSQTVTGIECCLCRKDAVASFGMDRRLAKSYGTHLKTYFAVGQKSVLMNFCAMHLNQAAMTWPGLAACPVQSLPRREAEGERAIEALRRKLADPAVRKRLSDLWKAGRDRGMPLPRPRPGSSGVALSAGTRQALEARVRAEFLGRLLVKRAEDAKTANGFQADETRNIISIKEK